MSLRVESKQFLDGFPVEQASASLLLTFESWPQERNPKQEFHRLKRVLLKPCAGGIGDFPRGI